MTWAPITKSSATWLVQPNMLDLDQTRATFTWDQVRSELGEFGIALTSPVLPSIVTLAGSFVIASLLRWLGRDGTILDTTYAQLRDQTNRFANVLAAAGRWQGRSRICPGRQNPGALHRSARHAEKHQRLLPTLLGVRPGTGPATVAARQCQGPGNHREAVPENDCRVARVRCQN